MPPDCGPVTLPLKQRDQEEAERHVSLQDNMFTIEDPSLHQSPVPLQRQYTGEKPVIPFALADGLCNDMCEEDLLEEMNRLMQTSYTLQESHLALVLERWAKRHLDFGIAYSHLRSQWDWARTAGGFGGVLDAFEQAEQSDREERSGIFANNQITKSRLKPRRVWDLVSNRVIPGWVCNPYPVGLSHLRRQNEINIFAISHAWVHQDNRNFEMTPINGREWPVPVPNNTNLERIRIEMLNLGADYAWLDILCLRQYFPESPESERLRAEEWEIDVPTIGGVYRMHSASTEVVYYLCGLGSPFTLGASLEDERHWLNRAWTLQEARPRAIIAGNVDGQVQRHKQLIEALQMIINPSEPQLGGYIRQLSNSMTRIWHLLGVSARMSTVFGLIDEMRRRYATKEIDKIAGLGYLLGSNTIPPYYESASIEEAWVALIAAESKEHLWDILFLYPIVGAHAYKWFPSWDQLMKQSIAAVPISEQENPSGRIGPDFLGETTARALQWRIKGPRISGPFCFRIPRADQASDYAAPDGCQSATISFEQGSQEFPILLSIHWRPTKGAHYILSSAPVERRRIIDPPDLPLYSCHWVVGRLLWDKGEEGCGVEKVSVLRMDQVLVRELDSLGLIEQGVLTYYT